LERLEPLERLERLQLPAGALHLLRSARVARLATADADGRPHVIPICFAFDGRTFYSPIDEKPKRTQPVNLKRIRNIRQNPQVSLVIDHYDEDWHKLAYVLVGATAKIIFRGKRHTNAVSLLRKKYRQYRAMAIDQRPMISITAKKIVVWGRV
jgi:PPOX class probable F420-dependent enzyme